MTDLNLVDFAPRLAERIPEDADVFSIEINPSPAFHDDEHFAIHLDGDREEIDRVAGAIFGHPIGDEWTNGVSLYGRTGMYGGWRVLVWGTDR